MEMPKYRVSLKDHDDCEILGYPECKQYGALFFMNISGEILKIFAPGIWSEITLIETHEEHCPTCGAPRWKSK